MKRKNNPVKRFLAVMMIMSLVLLLAPHGASGQGIPEWIKNNAAWWAEGAISESEFISAIQHLIKEGIIAVEPAEAAAQQSDTVPDWIKNTAAWWAEGAISDGEFVNAIQYLIASGIITVEPAEAADSELGMLQADLEACEQIVRAYERTDCQRAAKAAITAYDYRTNGESFEAGPVTFYYKGNDFEISQSGQALLDISLLAENTGSSENVTMMCTGPSICNYDVWNGAKAFKYAGTNFTSGQIVLKPGEAREFSMLFGPNIGYGGNKFEYDPSKDYVFRVMEPWGSTSIPLQLG